MLNLSEPLTRVFLIKETNLKREYDDALEALNLTKSFLVFIIDDINQGCLFGVKEENKVVYKVEEILKQLKIDRIVFLIETNCVDILKGLGIDAFLDIYRNKTLTLYFN
jgi:hypothetical protein